MDEDYDENYYKYKVIGYFYGLCNFDKYLNHETDCIDQNKFNMKTHTHIHIILEKDGFFYELIFNQIYGRNSYDNYCNWINQSISETLSHDLSTLIELCEYIPYSDLYLPDNIDSCSHYGTDFIYFTDGSNDIKDSSSQILLDNSFFEKNPNYRN